MSKEAILFILDVGPSMWKNGEKSLLNSAIKAVEYLIEQKIIDDRKSDHIGMVLFGTDGIHY